MGEIADMMLDGTLCEGCGVYLGGNGFVQRCAGCRIESAPFGSKNKIACPTSGKRVKKVGLADHRRDVHGVEGGEG